MEGYDFVELIRRYFRKELNEDELEDFNQLNSSNEEFMEKLREFKLFYELLDMESLYEKTQALLSDPTIRSSTDTLHNALGRLAEEDPIVDEHLYHSELVFASYKADFYRKPEESNITGLSTREIEILKLVSNGFSIKEIATKLSVAPVTVSTHKKIIMKKVQVKNIAGLVKYALAIGLIDPHSR